MKKLKLISLLLAALMLSLSLFACGEEASAAAPTADTEAPETTTEAETEPPIETEIKTNKSVKIAVGNTGSITARVKIDPSKDAALTITSSDEGVAKAASATAVPGDDGKAEIEISAVASGTATITVAASEYTVWETIGPAAAVTGYLLNGASKPDARWIERRPADDVRKLPGYAPLP